MQKQPNKAKATKHPRKMVHINFTADAWAKQMALLDHFSTEVGWHGAVRSLPDGGYEVYDIFVYPQQVTGSTVEVDWGGYDEWLMEHPEFEAIRYQAHSHVDFAPQPSGVDLESEKNRMVPDDQFYFFFIWNKQAFYTCRFYDHGVIRHQDEIILTVDEPYADFIEESKKMVKVLPPPTVRVYDYSAWQQKHSMKEVVLDESK